MKIQILSSLDSSTELPSLKEKSKPSARFNLRKRSLREGRKSVNISSYNSDFLTGLFADVAQANVLAEFGISEKRDLSQVSSYEDLKQPLPKRSKLGLHRSTAGDFACQTNLFEVVSPKGVNDIANLPPLSSRPASAIALDREDSLAYQLHCVSSSSSAESQSMNAENSQATRAVSAAARVAFPQLPVTISESSCSAGLTRNKLNPHDSSTETESKDSFGWFIDLDQGDDSMSSFKTGAEMVYGSTSTSDLAFQAATAPMSNSSDAELEWAKAADTVDDVLGDFF